jgi:spore germination cell wall hydrolase CwlJ-like protein
MSQADHTLQDTATNPGVSRWARVVEIIMFSVWTPLAVCVFSVVLIITVCATVMILTLIAEIDLAPGSGSLGRKLPSHQFAPTAYDFTLAPNELRAVTMDEARAFNAALPFSTLPIQAARPFIMPPENLVDYSRALDCLTAAVYYEAASETGPGQAAVAQVVINRMRHPAFPKTICGVVFQGQERTTGCQFSFTCDGALSRVPSVDGWARARAVAGAALNGSVQAEVGMATHYHTDWVAPYWAERLVKMRQIGTHIFYRWTEGWGLRKAFTGVYAGEEPVITKLSAVATSLEMIPPPVIDIATVTLEPAPLLVVVALPVAAPPPPIVDTPAEIQTPAPVAALPPPAPAIMADPLAPSSALAPRRNTRIAVPRN